MSVKSFINICVRQENSMSPKLFTDVMEAIFKKVVISEGIKVDGEQLANLNFDDNVAQFKRNNKNKGKQHLKSLT